MKVANKRSGSVRFLAVSCMVIIFVVCLAVDFGRPCDALAGETAGGGEPAPPATSTGTAQLPKATGTSTAEVPASTATGTSTGTSTATATGTGTSTAPKTATATIPKPPPGPVVTDEVRNRVNLIVNEIMKEHKGDPLDLIPLEEELAPMGLPDQKEELASMGLPVVEVLCLQLPQVMEESPVIRAVMARAIARVTGWYMPHATSRDIQRIQDWWKKNRTKKAEELKKDRIKDLLEQIKTKGKYIELYSIADAFGYVQDRESVAALRSLLLKHKDSLLRQKLLIALGKQKTADVVLIVVPYLKSKDEGVTVSAITALGLSGDEKAKEHLAPLVSSKSVSHRLAAVLALGRLGDRTHVKVLREIIEDKDKPENERVWALNVLAEVGAFNDHKWLVELLSTRNEFAFYYVGRTLEKLVGKTFGFASAEMVELNKRSEAVEEFKSWKVEIRRWLHEKHLVECLTDPNWLYRKRAFEKLKTIAKEGEVESEYDPIASQADCETKDDAWEYWVEGLQRRR